MPDNNILSSDLFKAIPANPIAATSNEPIRSLMDTDLFKGVPSTGKGIDGRYDPSAKLFQVFNTDLESFRNYAGGNSLPFVMGRPEAYEGRARSQTGWGLTGNSAAQFLFGEIVGGTVSGVGTLLAPDKWVDRFTNYKNAFDRTMLETLGDSIQKLTQETFPIYQTQKAQQGMALTDASWWATMMPSVGSVLSIMLPARLASILPAKLMKLMASSYELGKFPAIEALMGISKGGDAALSAAKFGMKADYWANVLSTSVAGRVIDSTRESLGRYDQYYQERKALGYNEEDAKSYAAEAAAGGFRTSHLNLAFDLMEWGIILKQANYLTKDTRSAMTKLMAGMAKGEGVTAKTAGELAGAEAIHGLKPMSRLKEFGIDAGKMTMLEGTDEVSMDVFQKEGLYNANRQRNEVPESTFVDRLGKHLGERKNWDSFFGGALGGLVMMPFGMAMQKIGNKKGIARMEEHVKTVVANSEYLRVQMQDMSKAKDAGDHAKYNSIKTNVMSDMATKSLFNNSTEWDIRTLESIMEKSDQQNLDQGVNPSIKQDIPAMIEGMKRFKQIFEQKSAYFARKNNKAEAHDLWIAAVASKFQFQSEGLDKIIRDLSKDLYGVEDSTNATVLTWSQQKQAYYAHIAANQDTLGTYEKLISAGEKSIQYHLELIDQRQAVLEKSPRASDRINAESDIAVYESKIETARKTIQAYKDGIVKQKANFDIAHALYNTKDGVEVISDQERKEADAFLNKSIIDKLDTNPDTQINDYKFDKTLLDEEVAHMNTDKGYQKYIDKFNKQVEENTNTLKEDLTEEVNAAKDEDVLNTLEAKYKKEGVDPIYQSIVDKRRRIIKEEVAHAAQQAARTTNPNATTEPIVTPTPAPTVEPTAVVNNVKEDVAIDNVELDTKLREAFNKIQNKVGTTVVFRDGTTDQLMIVMNSVDSTNSILLASGNQANLNTISHFTQNGKTILDFNAIRKGTTAQPATDSTAAHSIIPTGQPAVIPTVVNSFEEEDRIGEDLLREPKLESSDYFKKALQAYKGSNKDNHVNKLLDLMFANKALLKAFGLSESMTLEEANNLKKGDTGYNEFVNMIASLEGLTAELDSIFNILPSMDNLGFMISPKTGLLTTTDLNAVLAKSLKDKSVDIVKSAQIIESLKRYLSILDLRSFESVMLSVSRDTEDVDRNIQVRQDIIDTVGKLIKNRVGTSIEDITSTLRGFNDFMQLAYEQRFRDSGSTPSKITFKDVLSVLRDQDANNESINANWRNALMAMRILKRWYAGKVDSFNTDINAAVKRKASIEEVDLLVAERDKLKLAYDSLDLTGVDKITFEDDRSRTTEEAKVGPEYVAAFLTESPREVTSNVRKVGQRVVLNTFKEGDSIVVGEDPNFSLSDENKPEIYNHLSKITPGTELEFSPDYEYEYENRPRYGEDHAQAGEAIPYNWMTVPIRVKAKGADGTTLFWISSLDYTVSGFQYGKKTVTDKLISYDFHGMKEAFTENDYQTIVGNYEDSNSILKAFYVNYTNARKPNIDEAGRTKATEAYTKAYISIQKNTKLMEMFLRVFNSNREVTTTTLEAKNIAIMMEPFYYGIKSQYFNEYKPTLHFVKQSIRARDNAFNYDFNQVARFREELKEKDVVIKGTIDTVSTPSFLIEEDKKKGVILPRTTLDVKVKPITYKGRERILLARMHNDELVDMEDGTIIKDPRFDDKHAVSNHKLNGAHRSGMYVIVEASNGTLHAFDIKANTVGLSGNEHSRQKMVDAIALAFTTSLTSKTRDQVRQAMLPIKHTIIYDHDRDPNKSNEDNEKGFNFLDHDIFEYPDGTTDAWIRLQTFENGEQYFYQIENKRGNIAIYKSTRFKDVYIPQAILNHPDANIRADAIKVHDRYLIQDQDKSFTGLANARADENGMAALNVAIRKIIPLMLRQSHVDMKTGAFSFEKGYKGGEVIDPITNIKYDNAQDYYIKTGALYSNIGAAFDKQGKPLTNFDVKGKFPLSVTIDTSGSTFRNTVFENVDQLVEGRIIKGDDDYLSLIKEVETVLGSTMGRIVSTPKDERGVTIRPKNDAVAMVQYMARTTKQKFQTKQEAILFDAYFVLKNSMNRYDPASVNILHEFVHMFLNSKYKGRANETSTERSERRADIKYHNEVMTKYITELTAHWNTLSVEEKNKIVETFTTEGTDQVTANIGIFNSFIKIINDEMNKQNDKVAAAEINNTNLDHLDTIQEVLTYANSNPTVAMILNGMDTGVDQSAKRNKKSFWNLLKDKLFAILTRIFHIEYSKSGQYAKLNNMVNYMFSRPSAAKTQVTGSTKVVESEVELTDEEKEDIAFEKTLRDNITPIEPIEPGQLSEGLAVPITFDIVETAAKEDISLKGIIEDFYINPTQAVLDANNNPIC